MEGRKKEKAEKANSEKKEFLSKFYERKKDVTGLWFQNQTSIKSPIYSALLVI